MSGTLLFARTLQIFSIFSGVSKLALIPETTLLGRSREPITSAMAGRLPYVFILLATLFSSLSSTLQVSPNSPCASFCLDSTDLDKSDPNSSNTNGTDIVCSDEDFERKDEGQKYQRCMSCLQDSSFEQSPENDQDWFLCMTYNTPHPISSTNAVQTTCVTLSTTASLDILMLPTLVQTHA